MLLLQDPEAELEGTGLETDELGMTHVRFRQPLDGFPVWAREIVVQGTLNGNVHASEKIEIRKTGSILGDLTTARIIIEDGAYFKGSIDILKPGQKPELPRLAAAAPAKPSAQSALHMTAAPRP